MKIRILTNPSNVQSAGKLGYPTYTRNDDILDDLGDHDYDIMVRWGHGSGYDHSRIFNTAKSIKGNRNKLIAREAISRVVNVPEIYTHSVPDGIKAVVRTLEHSRGENFEVVTGPVDVLDGHYASKFIAVSTEYRVWFAGQHMLCASRVPMESLGQTADDLCRSKWGYDFHDVLPEELGKQVQLGRRCLNLDIGAADVLWNPEEGKYYFLEYNSGCSIDNGEILSFFKRHIQDMAIEKYGYG